MKRASKRYLENMVSAYTQCALWTCEDEISGTPSLDCVKKFEADCAAFLWGIGSVDVGEIDASQMGHDFWLTRNRHGAGFWDRGLGEIGEFLTRLSKTFPECDLYVSDKNEIEVM